MTTTTATRKISAEELVIRNLVWQLEDISSVLDHIRHNIPRYRDAWNEQDSVIYAILEEITERGMSTIPALASEGAEEMITP